MWRVACGMWHVQLVLQLLLLALLLPFLGLGVGFADSANVSCNLHGHLRKVKSRNSFSPSLAPSDSLSLSVSLPLFVCLFSAFCLCLSVCLCVFVSPVCAYFRQLFLPIFIPATCRVGGYFNFNACYRQKEAWQSTQNIYILGQLQQSSSCCHFRLSIYAFEL